MPEHQHALDQLMMAQQPILNRNKVLFGYELLFRGQVEDHAEFDNAEVATSQVITNLCIGITKLEAQLRQPFFINMTTNLVLSDAFFPISANTVYIEILENQRITKDFVAAVIRWHDSGFRFVLDDYHFDPTYDDLLPYISMIKIDVLSTPPDTILDKIEYLKSLDLTLIAEKVEDREMFERCKELGFTYFQGYFLQRPEVVKGRRVDANTQSAIRLVNTLQKEHVSIEEVADLVTQNPTLSYQMLRLINSPVVGVLKEVSSIKEAVVYLGLVQLKRWAMLITLSSQNHDNADKMRVLLVRARCCEILARKSNAISPDSAFTMGLMSGIHVLLQMDQKEVLGQITLDKEIKEAILHFNGPLGRILFSATSIEGERWESIGKLPANVRRSLNHAFFDSLQWAHKVMSTLK
ncbi:diguanylate phosphodiesterase [Marinomonas piezotolerans]|uniref:Diguanylate phosphodiesterase n=1 Tax=Marinomonas piezotolerans TaxID=2213058 RepID=A0A370U6P0_9GAMM|nr:HDOD domain-containing protein [Marinomonas piezotolerans]RDL43423.1 diguanylate phosphodiesterase [Marinomonas piezotolerans]